MTETVCEVQSRYVDDVKLFIEREGTSYVIWVSDIDGESQPIYITSRQLMNMMYELANEFGMEFR